ncbi:progestin and adipoQ receptor family member 4-like [Saccoglossus kowalevskii]
MSHAGGAVVYKKLLRLDMCGSWTANTFGVLSTFAAPFQDTMVLSWLVPIVYLMLSTFSIHKAVTSKCQSDRVLAFLSPVIYRWTVVVLRVFGKIGGNPFANYYLVWMEVLAAAGAIINVCRIPERWLPGRFDYVMNSHQIMHILSIHCIDEFTMGCRGRLSLDEQNSVVTKIVLNHLKPHSYPVQRLESGNGLDHTSGRLQVNLAPKRMQ